MKAAKIRPSLDDELSALDIFKNGFTGCKNQTATIISKIKDPQDKFPEVMT